MLNGHSSHDIKHGSFNSQILFKKKMSSNCQVVNKEKERMPDLWLLQIITFNKWQVESGMSKNSR